tara:strand:+ start:5434 stop:5646 length:213 start_codon:yes stop_codon:yes gene_type:complete
MRNDPNEGVPAILLFAGRLSIAVGLVGIWFMAIGFLAEEPKMTDASIYFLAFGAVGYAVADASITRNKRA